MESADETKLGSINSKAGWDNIQETLDTWNNRNEVTFNSTDCTVIYLGFITRISGSPFIGNNRGTEGTGIFIN